MSSFTWKSLAAVAAMTCSLAGATMRTVGVGAAGSGLASPCVSVTAAAGGASGAVAALLAAGAAAEAIAGAGGGGGGGGGRLSLPPPQATASASGSIEERATSVFRGSMGGREDRPMAARAQDLELDEP